MTEYQIQPGSRRCSQTGRELKPGEKFYTVLIENDGRFVRMEYAPEAWSGPPPDAFSFWMAHVPRSDSQPKMIIDDDLLMDCFQRLDGQVETKKLHFRYVVALLLMRRKRFRFEDMKVVKGDEILVLRCVRTKAVYEVLNPQLSEAEIEQVQEQVVQLLGWS